MTYFPYNIKKNFSVDDGEFLSFYSHINAMLLEKIRRIQIVRINLQNGRFFKIIDFSICPSIDPVLKSFSYSALLAHTLAPGFPSASKIHCLL